MNRMDYSNPATPLIEAVEEVTAQTIRLDKFKAYMIGCFGIRWVTVCPIGKIKLMKQCFYAGYKSRGES